MNAEEHLKDNLSLSEQMLIEESVTLPLRLIEAMEQYATEKEKHTKECNKDLVRKLGTAQMRIEELEEEVKRLKAFDNGDSFPM